MTDRRGHDPLAIEEVGVSRPSGQPDFQDVESIKGPGREGRR
ncbi:hypothetical protein V6V47_23945 [Micromonospora sp. CPCC 205539]